MLIPTITLQPGDSGENVRELQRRLAAVDQLSEDQINGSYDGPTTEAVRSFQGLHGLDVDGIAGPRTIRKLNAVVAGTAGNNDSDTRKEEEEVEQEIETVEQAAMALEQQERQLTEEELGLANHEPAMPPPPKMDEPKLPEMEQGTADSLFLDDPSLETNALKGKDEQAKAQEQEAKAQEQAPKEMQKPQGEALAQAEQSAKAEQELAAQQAIPKEPIRFDDKALDAIDKSLSEPVKMEVKEAGVVMMKNGVQQTAVPPDMQIGGPSVTPQQQKQQTAELG